MVEHYMRNGSREIVGDGAAIKALLGRIDQVARCDRAGC